MDSNPQQPLSGRRAYVCGSTQGIGKACAVELARLGAAITLIARNEDALRLVLSEFAASSPDQPHDFIQADFTDWEALRERVHEHVAAHGPIHILINNTGGPPAGTAVEALPEAYLDGFKLHILCNQALVQAVVTGMRDARFGRIVNIISTSVVTPIANLGVSNTIRGAVANWGRTLAAELGQFGITVNNVLPGYTNTGRLGALIQGRASRAGCTVEEIERQMQSQVPVRRFATPEEIAAAVGFLCTPAAAYVNGVNLPVDGGRLVVQ